VLEDCRNAATTAAASDFLVQRCGGQEVGGKQEACREECAGGEGRREQMIPHIIIIIRASERRKGADEQEMLRKCGAIEEGARFSGVSKDSKVSRLNACSYANEENRKTVETRWVGEGLRHNGDTSCPLLLVSLQKKQSRNPIPYSYKTKKRV
jgi:hypothetical protein